MNRLTKKNNIGYFPAYERETKENYYDLVHKLGVLEDIEEELGIDLITLFDIYNKMAKQKYVYIKYIDIGKVVKDDLHNGYFVINFKKKEIEEIYYEPCNWYEFKNYGKTWALTREELENE